ncbi:MAG: PorV/PorQ family protein [bacterium]
MTKNVSLSFYLGALLFCYFVTSAFAGGEGTTAAQFLKIALNPQIEGKGGAAVASFNDEIFYNPASISKVNKVSSRAGYVSWFEDISKANVFCAVPLGRSDWKLAGDLSYFQIGGLKNYDGSGNEIDAFDRNSVSFSAGVAKNSGNISFGLVIKGISEKYDAESGSAFAADAGVIVSPANNISLGFSVQNFGTKLGISNVEKKLPENKKLGICLRPAGILELNFDIDMPSDSDNRSHFGAEIEFAKNYFLRAGQQTFGEISGVTFGFGMKFPASSRSSWRGYTPEASESENMISVDYGYQSNSEFDAIHRFSVGVEF